MDDDLILLGHGSGGKLSHQLLDDLIIPRLSPLPFLQKNDAALLEIRGARLAFTTDSYVVDPLFFPGGDIGELAVNGTVNDLAMMGARPLYLSAALVLEEGFTKSDLSRILCSMRGAADAAGIAIVTGDTKVVPKGKGDRIFINTSGIGVLEHPFRMEGAAGRPGDRVLVNGNIGDHGIAVLGARAGMDLSARVRSDTAALHGLVGELLTLGAGVHVLRDPTRGGVATTLKEIALQSGVTIVLREESLPVDAAVRGVCSILGLDPLYVANEGKLLALVAPERAGEALQILQRHPLGKDAAIIGEVVEESCGRLLMESSVGGVRGIEMLAGEQLPRIC